MYIDVRMEITKENRDEIFALIDKLLIIQPSSSTTPISIAEPIGTRTKIEQIEDSKAGLTDILSAPPIRQKLASAKPNIGHYASRADLIGSQVLFNSFYPIKAACRMIGNFTASQREEECRLDRFVSNSITCFSKRGLEALRGFPSSNKSSAYGRYVLHFLNTACEMGILYYEQADQKEQMPTSLLEWDHYRIALTNEGLTFAAMDNNVFDHGSKTQVFSEGERNWLLDYLKKIESQNYREYSILREVYQFLKEGHDGKNDLRKWFLTNTRFNRFADTWSKQENMDETTRLKQMTNLAASISGSKIALLRELGLISNRRNDYRIMGDFE
jgi:hypothetical protein